MQFNMLHTIKIILCSAITLVALTSGINAQKFGHVNSSDIIQAHPMITSANTQLETYQKDLMAPFDAQSKAFEADYKAFVDQSNSGTLSQLASQNKQAALQVQQDSLN